MATSESERLSRLRRYLDRALLSTAIAEKLGEGQDGAVWRSDCNTAIKVFARERNDQCERDCYWRLQDAGCGQVGIFTVLAMIGHDDELQVIEMDIVTPPYLLDFGKAYLDTIPPFSREIIDETLARAEELFEPKDWPYIEDALMDLRRIGIHYLDVKPANVRPSA